MFLSYSLTASFSSRSTVNHVVSVTRKEETMFEWKFPVTLWGGTGSALRRKHLARLDTL